MNQLFAILVRRPSRERSHLIAILSFLVAVNVLTWLWAWAAFGDQPALLGTALLAYLFGLRHAVDPDHIAAIDNVVRKLVQEGKKPVAVGFFFSVGHSTLIVLAVAVIASTTVALQNQWSEYKAIGGVISTIVSSCFLLLIAATNGMILLAVWRNFRKIRAGIKVSDEDMDTLLSGRGFIARLFRPLFRLVTQSWHMFPIGFLFGLGFDTATEIGLFSVSASHAAQDAASWRVMVFPALFAAGMALVDTLDSALMVGAYGWAFENPLRKVWYNLTITSISVLVAIGIGGIEALSLLGEQFALVGPFWDAVAQLNSDLANFGYWVVGVFVLSWVVSIGIYKWRGFETNLVRVDRR